MTGDIDPLASRNSDATGLWGDEHTLRVGQNGNGAHDGVFAYDRWSGDRLPDLEFEIDETNRAPRGVWSDGETMWVSDSGQDRLFAYNRARRRARRGCRVRSVLQERQRPRHLVGRHEHVGA